MTHVLRYRITAHMAADIAYDGSAKDYARALTEYEAKLDALKATGAAIVLEDAKPVNVRKITITEPLIPAVAPAVEMPMVDPLDIPDFMKRKA